MGALPKWITGADRTSNSPAVSKRLSVLARDMVLGFDSMFDVGRSMLSVRSYSFFLVPWRRR